MRENLMDKTLTHSPWRNSARRFYDAAWLRLQVRYDLEVAEAEFIDRISCELNAL